MSIKTAVIGGDMQIPYHDPVATKLFVGFIKRTQPDEVFLNGDIYDFYSCSRFSKDPSRMDNLQEELDIGKEILQSIIDAAPKATIHFIKGNHEERLRKYLWNNAHAFAKLRSLSLPKLLGLWELGIKFHKEGCWFGDLYITHGSVIRKHAGYTARAEFEKNGCSGLSNHSHRDGKYTVRNRGGHFVWFENYCLCDLKPEYVEGIANWTQGFSYVTRIGNRPMVEQIAIIGGKYIYGGQIYGA